MYVANKEGQICKVVQVSRLGVGADLQASCYVGRKGGCCICVRDDGVATEVGHCVWTLWEGNVLY